MLDKKAAEPIEQLQQKEKIPAHMMAGVMTQQGWHKGKSVSRAEFLAAVNRFKAGKAGG